VCGHIHRYLRIEVGKGRGCTNRYAPVFENTDRTSPIDDRKGEPPFALKSEKVRIPVHKNANPHAEKGERPFAQNPFKNPFKGTRSSSSARKTGWPQDLTVNDELISIAVDQGYGPEEAHRMFKRFKWHHLSKGNQFADWIAAWHAWVSNQLDFDARTRAAETARSTHIDGRL
jgi:hypothetical protein